MFENRRMPNGTFEPSLGLCGVGGRTCEGSLYPIWLFSQFESLKSGKKVGESAPQRNHSIPIFDVTLTAVRGTLIALAEEERASDLLPSHVAANAAEDLGETEPPPWVSECSGLSFSRLTKCMRFWVPECSRSFVRMLKISQSVGELITYD